MRRASQVRYVFPDEGRTCWKNFSRQTDRLVIKFNYRHCSISMPVVEYFVAIFADTRKMGPLAALNGGSGGSGGSGSSGGGDNCGQIWPGILSWKQGRGSTARGIPTGGIGR
jgi:hypothetical protein